MLEPAGRGSLDGERVIKPTITRAPIPVALFMTVVVQVDW
jgi:hypothetical protein